MPKVQQEAPHVYLWCWPGNYLSHHKVYTKSWCRAISESPNHNSLLFWQHTNHLPPDCSCHNSSPKQTPQHPRSVHHSGWWKPEIIPERKCTRPAQVGAYWWAGTLDCNFRLQQGNSKGTTKVCPIVNVGLYLRGYPSMSLSLYVMPTICESLLG